MSKGGDSTAWAVVQVSQNVQEAGLILSGHWGTVSCTMLITQLQEIILFSDRPNNFLRTAIKKM